MIAKVLGTGTGFSGKINYLFEGRMEDRKAEQKQAIVICHSENVRVPHSYTDQKGIERMKADFINQAQNYRYYSKEKGYIGEHVLAFTGQDRKDLRGGATMKQITEEYINLVGINKTQYVAVSHQDTANPHVHILFNRVTFEGKKFDDFQEKKRAMYAGILLSQKYGLGLTGELQKKAEETGAKKMRSQMEDFKLMKSSNELLQNARNLHHLQKLAASHGQFFEDKGISIVLNKKEYTQLDLEVMFWQNRSEVKTPSGVESQTAIFSQSINRTEEGRAEEKRIDANPKLSLPSGKGIEEGKAVKRKKRAPDYRQKINKLSKSHSLKP